MVNSRHGGFSLSKADTLRPVISWGYIIQKLSKFIPSDKENRLCSKSSFFSLTIPSPESVNRVLAKERINEKLVNLRGFYI